MSTLGGASIVITSNSAVKHSAPSAILIMLLLIVGCVSQPAWVQYELCFGLTANGGKTRVSDPQWAQFRDAEIMPRFPDGFTVYAAEGYWRSGANSYSEPSRVVMIVTPDSAEAARKIEEIARSYKQQFHQESVLQIRSRVMVDFSE